MIFQTSLIILIILRKQKEFGQNKFLNRKLKKHWSNPTWKQPRNLRNRTKIINVIITLCRIMTIIVVSFLIRIKYEEEFCWQDQRQAFLKTILNCRTIKSLNKTNWGIPFSINRLTQCFLIPLWTRVIRSILNWAVITKGSINAERRLSKTNSFLIKGSRWSNTSRTSRRLISRHYWQCN